MWCDEPIQPPPHSPHMQGWEQASALVPAHGFGYVGLQEAGVIC